MIAHHPGEELIAAYAAGTLDEASALALATHITLCPRCRKHHADLEALGGALIEDMVSEPLAENALANTLARVRDEPRLAVANRPQINKATPLLPLPLQFYVGGDIDAAKWKPLGPGIHHMPLIDEGGTSARLLRIEPGKSVFEHSHHGNELTLVLRGSYQSLGESYRRGDLEMADGTIEHRPIAGTEDTCICLAVTDAPLRFGHWLGRLMQPFIGI
jgi:putative transcriptional regulator